MKILTWNINGLRATKSPITQVLNELDADIICIQETKVAKEQLESCVAIVEGYNSYFSFAKVRQGYSGVATFCKDAVTPTKAQEGLFDTFEKNCAGEIIGCYGDLKSIFSDDRSSQLDKEGRTIITQFEFLNENAVDKLTILNVYCPRADPEKPVRMKFKLDFYRALKERANSILNSGSHVIVCGDVNTSHRVIDHCNWDDPETFGDSPFREWIDGLLYNKGDYSTVVSSIHDVTQESENRSTDTSDSDKNFTTTETIDLTSQCLQTNTGNFVDTFRYFFPDRKEAYTCWSTLKGSRETNYGTRIDYIFANHDFHSNFIEFCDIHPEIEGSDHCPVKAELKINIKSSTKCPPCCTKYMPEFGGRQQKLSDFFTKKSPSKKFIDHFSPKKQSVEYARPADISKSSFSSKRKAADDKNIKACKQSKLTFFMRSPPKITETCAKNTAADSSSSLSKSSCPEIVSITDEKNTEKFPKKFENVSVTSSKTSKSTAASVFWKSVLKGPGRSPLCSGHKESSLLRTVKKEGPNLGRQFYVCCRPEGRKDNPEARCSFFQWKANKK